jgi:hypothetical protein
MTDYKALADGKFKEWGKLHARMDGDRDLVNLAKYILRDTDNHIIPHAISITLNDPLVFAVNVESALNAAVEQVTVESENKRLDTDYIEDVIRAVFKETDKRLARQGRYNLNPFTDQMVTRRGRAAGRCLVNIKDGILNPEIIPWDTRYVVYGMDTDGLAWISYKTLRTQDMVGAEYPDFIVTNKNEQIEVQDIWTRVNNEVWIGNKQITEQKHGYGSVPAAVQIVPCGSMTMDANTIEHQGESIFYMIRDLVPELNRLVSIIQNMNISSFDRALQLHIPDEQITGNPPPQHDEVTKPGAVNVVPVGGGYDFMPLDEIKQSAILLHQMIETRVQRGGVSNFDMGTFTQPMSAVALVEVGEGRDQVFLPRLGARGLLKQQLAEMFIQQIIQSGESSVMIGRKEVQVSKLDGDYDITFKYFIKSPKVDIARYTMAEAAGNLVSNKMKRESILQLEDPAGEERQLRSEEAELLSPRIKMYRTIKALLEEGEHGDEDAQLEAEMLAMELGITLEQVMSGNFEPTTPTPAQAPKPMIPLMGGSSAANNSLGSKQESLNG